MDLENFEYILIFLLYIFSGYGKIINFEETANGLHKKQIFNLFTLEISKLAIILTILLLICGSIIVIYDKFKPNKVNKKFIYYLKISFIVFTILATYLYHYPDSKPQKIHFLKNCSIIGGLLLILNK